MPSAPKKAAAEGEATDLRTYKKEKQREYRKRDKDATKEVEDLLIQALQKATDLPRSDRRANLHKAIRQALAACERFS